MTVRTVHYAKTMRYPDGGERSFDPKSAGHGQAHAAIPATSITLMLPVYVHVPEDCDAATGTAGLNASPSASSRLCVRITLNPCGGWPSRGGPVRDLQVVRRRRAHRCRPRHE